MYYKSTNYSTCIYRMYLNREKTSGYVLFENFTFYIKYIYIVGDGV